MAKRADAHIHLFERGYQGDSFARRPGVSLDEAALYESFMADHGIEAALVVGYEGQPWCSNNNDFLAQMKSEGPWIRPTAFINMEKPPATAQLEAWAEQGFAAISRHLSLYFRI